MLDDTQVIKHFPALLKGLKALIKALPGLPVSLPLATPDGPLSRYLGDLEIDAEEGARYTANRQWERTFQVSVEEQRRRIALGKYGVALICPFLEFYCQQKGIKDTDGVGMLARRIRDLNTILDLIPGTGPPPVAVPPSKFFAQRPKTTMDSSSVVPAKRSAAPDSDDDPSDKNYKPPHNHPVVSEEDDVPEDALPPKGKEKAKKPEKFAAKKDQTTTKKPPAKKLKAADSADEYGDDEDAPVATTGRNPKKGHWVIMNYQSPPTLVVDSNFHSHLRSCKGIPEDASFEDFEAAEAAEKAGTQPVPVASVSNVAAQRQSMSKFVQEGRDNPAIVVTRRGFRKHLIEGIAYDDLPFTFSEKKGMRSLLTYLLPRGWKSDITRLSTLLRERVFRYAGAVLM
ncbi:hypothetical protein B0H13DRAFT_2307801 [Mycena leptocephala]|nr:hypothetical protein B0H13DRAFT_2307801 [Mycena leptocephala]